MDDAIKGTRRLPTEESVKCFDLAFLRTINKLRGEMDVVLCKATPKIIVKKDESVDDARST
jgi:hypothetical protein